MPARRAAPARRLTGCHRKTVAVRQRQRRRGLGFQRSAQVAARRQAFAGGFTPQAWAKKYARLSPASLVRCMAVSASRSSSGRVAAVVGNHHHAARQTGAAPISALQRLGNHGQQAFDGACSLVMPGSDRQRKSHSKRGKVSPVTRPMFGPGLCSALSRRVHGAQHVTSRQPCRLDR